MRLSTPIATTALGKLPDMLVLWELPPIKQVARAHARTLESKHVNNFNNLGYWQSLRGLVLRLQVLFTPDAILREDTDVTFEFFEIFCFWKQELRTVLFIKTINHTRVIRLLNLGDQVCDLLDRALDLLLHPHGVEASWVDKDLSGWIISWSRV